MKRFLAIIPILALAGCAGAVPWNPQGYSGITSVDVELKDGVPVSVHWRDGKEKASTTMTADVKTGTITYAASDVRAFDGQAIRQAVETAVSQNVADVTPAAMEAIIQAVLKAFVPVP